MILVDTSVLVDHLRQDDKTDTSFRQLVATPNLLAISIITHTELFSGKSVWEHSKARQQLDTILGGLDIIPLTTAASIKAGQINAKHDTGPVDAIIAATAITHQLPLATLNTKHFQDIPNLKLHSLNSEPISPRH